MWSQIANYLAHLTSAGDPDDPLDRLNHQIHQAAINRIIQSFPEEVMDCGTYNAAHFSSNGTCFYKAVKDVGRLKKVTQHVNGTKLLEKEKLEELLTKISLVDNYKKKIIDGKIDSTEKILEELHEEMETVSNKLAWASIATDAILIVNEIVSIYKVWSELYSTKGVIDESEKKLAKMKPILDDWIKKLEVIKNDLDILRDSSVDIKSKRRTYRKMEWEFGVLKEDIAKMKGKLKGIKLRTKDGIKSIEKLHQQQFLKAGLNTFSGIVDIPTTCMLLSANPLIAGLKIFTNFGIFAIAAKNYQTALECGDSVKKLNIFLENVNEFKERFDRFAEEVKQAKYNAYLIMNELD